MIEIDNRQNQINITEEIINVIENSIISTLQFEGFNKPFEVSVVLTDNNGIQVINKEFRNIDRDTDVLSFPMLDFEEGYTEEGEVETFFEDINPDTGEVVLGDIVISAQKAFSQAEEYGHSIMREIGFLTVHSTLHLLGYDHEIESDRIIMRSKEEDILGVMKLFR